VKAWRVYELGEPADVLTLDDVAAPKVVVDPTR
jgi:hypothetical protein